MSFSNSTFIRHKNKNLTIILENMLWVFSYIRTKLKGNLPKMNLTWCYSCSHETDKDASALNWYRRLEVALGVAQGLEYLHTFAVSSSSLLYM